ncbi:Nucleophile aminohydrolase, N-terminal [Parasponia andersonii]|uniref:Nucleophile aminohydrolase, N-terminal n=1 Tax=Parasponia andersonii TaxID=3476 RepID=A0A2P5B0H2_PARAD|nr:Nucleophile aminohydrolase, N-terminal [Parasponia andersonii]
MGSGSLAAMAEEEGIDLACVLYGIFNDLGSGSNVDVCVIKKILLLRGNKEYLRNHQLPNPHTFMSAKNVFVPKTGGSLDKGHAIKRTCGRS